MKSVLCRVSGRVQGVWFRGSAQKQALKLGVTGYALNLPDGRVEVLACGDDKAVEAMLAWLHRGPPLAHVSAVESEPVDTPSPAAFTIG